MELLPFDPTRLPELMAWFPDAPSCRAWGGPNFRFPFDERSFATDCRIDSMPSWGLCEPHRPLLAFGQYYPKSNRCHLARLVVAPAIRGGGVGGQLIRQLCRRASTEIAATAFSLYVMQDNEPAWRLYRRMGFVEAESPDTFPPSFGPILFMVAEGPAARALRQAGES